MSQARQLITCLEAKMLVGHLAECVTKAMCTGFCVTKMEWFWTLPECNLGQVRLTILKDEDAASLLKAHLKGQDS